MSVFSVPLSLYVPREIAVTTGPRGEPLSITLNGKFMAVATVRNSWRIDDEWWRQEISRVYYELLLRDGSVRTVFQDLKIGKWYWQRC